MEAVLWLIVGTVTLLVVVFASAIANSWLQARPGITTDVVTDSVQLMALAIAPQIAMSLHIGGLLGMQAQVKANSLIVIFGIVRSALVLVPIALWPDPRVFFAWQIVASWVFLAISRWYLLRALAADSSKPMVDCVYGLRPLVPYASGMLGMALIAGLNTQIDKIAVSSLRPLEEFTYYSLGATVAQLPALVALPLSLALLPRLTALKEQANVAQLYRLYTGFSFAIASVASVAGCTLIVYADEFLQVWLGSATIPDYIVPITQLLVLGGWFLALQLAPFQLSLANGHNRTNVQLGLVVLTVTVPLQFYLISRYGIAGAPLPWLFMNAFAFVYLGIVLNQRFNRGGTLRWFLYANLPPTLIAVLFVVVGKVAAVTSGLGALLQLLVALAFGVAALLFSAGLWRLTGRFQVLRSRVP
jgi:O-antigen/teichoic acid export membrane protein